MERSGMFVAILFAATISVCDINAQSFRLRQREGRIREFLEWLGAVDPFSSHSTSTTTVEPEVLHKNESTTTLKPSQAEYTDEEKASVVFYMFNKKRNGSEKIKLDAEYWQIDQYNFIPYVPLKVLIHGYKMTGFSHFSHLLREAYLEYQNEANVISVDWRDLAGDAIYFKSAFNTRIVGERVGEVLVFLKQFDLIQSYDQVHIVGFSLGAHVAGFAGKYVYKTSHEKVGRITGLDPAGPSFSSQNGTYRLNASDAKFVDVIHTCMGNSGIMQTIGHVDFFPNGGYDQPGCGWERIKSFLLKNCSHERSFFLFWETIKNKTFIGCDCGSWEDFQFGVCPCSEKEKGAVLMGEHCPTSARGSKYLVTSSLDTHQFESDLMNKV